MTLRARVEFDWPMGGVAVFMANTSEYGTGGYVYETVDGHVRQTYRSPEEGAPMMDPTLRLGEDEARALLEALLDHFRGGSDVRNVREDLRREQGRVDKLLDTVSEIARRS